eukprot:Gb_16651 [translate_table: standard]
MTRLRASEPRAARPQSPWDHTTWINLGRSPGCKDKRLEKRGELQAHGIADPDVMRSYHLLPCVSISRAHNLTGRKGKRRNVKGVARPGSPRSRHASSSCAITVFAKKLRENHVPKFFEPRRSKMMPLVLIPSLLEVIGMEEGRIVIPMAPKSSDTELPTIFKLQFNDTLLRRELMGDKNLKTYNDIYYEVEKAESLYAGQEEISEDDEEYKSDLLSIKAVGLHKIAAKPEVFPCKDLFSRSMKNYMLERGVLASPIGTLAIISRLVFRDLYKMPQPDLVYNANKTKAFLKGKYIVKTILRDWAEHPKTFKKRANLNYPISQFRRGIRIGMLLLNRLYGAVNTDHVNQYWVPLLGEIIMIDGNPTSQSSSLSTYTPIGRSPEQVGTSSWLPMAIHGRDMPRISETVRSDLSRIRAWWYFEKATIIRVEGTFTPQLRLGGLSHPLIDVGDSFSVLDSSFSGKTQVAWWLSCDQSMEPFHFLEIIQRICRWNGGDLWHSEDRRISPCKEERQKDLRQHRQE